MQVQDAMEDLLDAVWRAERDWKFNDRIDLSVTPGRREQHICQIPEDDSLFVFNCPCGQKWIRKGFANTDDKSVWLPA